MVEAEGGRAAEHAGEQEAYDGRQAEAVADEDDDDGEEEKDGYLSQDEFFHGRKRGWAFRKSGDAEFFRKGGPSMRAGSAGKGKNCVILAFFSVLRNEEGSFQGLRKKVLRKTSFFLRGKASRRH